MGSPSKQTHPHVRTLQDHPNITNTPTQHSKHTSPTPYPKAQAKANHTLGSEHTKHKPNTPTHHAQSNPSTNPTLQFQNHQTPAHADTSPDTQMQVQTFKIQVQTFK